jgi:putative hydrolase of the HAD superfamily
MIGFKTLTPNKLDRLPKAILIDVDNTLYPYAPCHEAASRRVEDKVMQVLGIDREIFRDASLRARDEIKKRLGRTASSHSRLLYFQRAMELMGLHTQTMLTLDLEQTYWRTYLATSTLFDGVVEFFELLKQLGIPTAIVTDLTAQIQFRKLIYLELDHLVDHIVTSEEAGVDKPAELPFDLALAKLAVDAEGCWMIGDSAESDLLGARRCGLCAVQKIHRGVKVGEGEARPDAMFEHFEDLCAQLRRLKRGLPVEQHQMDSAEAS